MSYQSLVSVIKNSGQFGYLACQAKHSEVSCFYPEEICSMGSVHISDKLLPTNTQHKAVEC